VRYAILVFCDPDHDTVIISPKNPPIRFGDYALRFT